MAAFALSRRSIRLRDRVLRTNRLRGIGWAWACRWCGEEGKERTRDKACAARAMHMHTCPRRPW